MRTPTSYHRHLIHPFTTIIFITTYQIHPINLVHPPYPSLSSLPSNLILATAAMDYVKLSFWHFGATLLYSHQIPSSSPTSFTIPLHNCCCCGSLILITTLFPFHQGSCYCQVGVVTVRSLSSTSDCAINVWPSLVKHHRYC